MALKALNSRLIDGTKDTPKVNNIEPEKKNEVVISIGESEHTSQESSSNNIMTSNKTT